MTDAVRRHETSDTKEVLPLSDAIDLSRELARRLAGLQRPADVVVAIAEGGLLPGRVVADELGLPLRILRVRRGGSAVKQRLARVPGLARAAVAASRAPVLGALVRGALHALDAASRGADEAKLPSEWRDLAGLRALLVDDAQQRGETLRRARALLESTGATCVASGVLTWSPRGRAPSPDAWIGRRLQHYPWSGGSPHRAEYRRWLAGRALAPLGLLLLDLDGVLVASSQGDVVRAHEDAAAAVARLGAPAVVVTHRSRAEADVLLASAGVALPAWTAESLWLRSLVREPLQLVRRGSAKGVAVRPLCVQHEVAPEDLVALDDREDVLADYLSRGVGLALLAPSASLEGGSLRTFDLSAALALAAEWWSRDRARAHERELVRLPAVELAMPAWAAGSTVSVAPGPAGALRRAASRLRRRLVG